ncbi:ribonuclease H-like domain-containing protein, partial [Tanacetum coccineum]
MRNLLLMSLTVWQSGSYVYNVTLGWIIDSGTNQHMTTSTKNMFNVVDISSLKLSVGHPNGTMANIIAIGSLRLTKNVVLFDVLVIPEYIVNLLSVNKMIKDSKYFVGFDETKCYIQDLKLGNIVGTGSESGGLYMFDYDHNGKTFAGMSNYGIVSYVSKELWHCRLGHPADQVLSVLSDKIGFKTGDHISACDICHKAKQTREPFPLSDHKSSKIGDLIRLDFEIKVKVIRSDNGTEFVNNKMFDLFTSLGIIHQTSCSHTPQQNGIAERKHKHLLNVARSLMFQGGIPLRVKGQRPLRGQGAEPLAGLRGSAPFSLDLSRLDTILNRLERSIQLGLTSGEDEFHNDNPPLPPPPVTPIQQAPHTLSAIKLSILKKEDHLAKFYKMTDANDMWEAIKSRFCGNDESKKMQKYILKHNLKAFLYPTQKDCTKVMIGFRVFRINFRFMVQVSPLKMPIKSFLESLSLMLKALLHYLQAHRMWRLFLLKALA